MRVEKNAEGWLACPDTSDEEKALAFVLDALENRYGRPVSTSDASQATDSQPEGQSRNKAA